MNMEAGFQDIHAGETCIVVGNGPSLKGVPIAFLKKYPSFGTNRIYLHNGFTPTYYCSVNPLVIEQSAEEINAISCRAKFIAADYASLIPRSYGLVSTSAQLFSFNPASYIYEGYTVTYVCMQLAFFMGFRTVLLVGVDHKFIMNGTPNAETVWEGNDPNHFDESYFKDARWNNPDLGRSAQAYALAEKAFRENKRRILNLTKDTALDVFTKEPLKKWM